MRIIGGQYRSRVLAPIRGEGIRPTSDRVKESLFGILSPRLYGARVLDLFCGSGALGLESLSRGAKEAVFNDCSKESLEVLKKNLRLLKLEARTYCLDYMQCLDTLYGKFDIIFLDPPYSEDLGVRAMGRIAEKKLLREGGVIVYERDRSFGEDMPDCRLQKTDERKYGKTWLSFFSLCQGTGTAAEERR